MRTRDATPDRVPADVPSSAPAPRPVGVALAIALACVGLAAAGLGSLGSLGCSGPRDETALTVFAAASLRDVIDELAASFTDERGVRIVRNYAGSNVLARQIRATDEADVFLSADETWMDDVDRAGRTVEGTRRTFLSNRLVVVAHRESPLELDGPEDLVGAGVELVSVADPDSVPAGRYARSWLRTRRLPDGRTVWEAIEDRLAPAPDVRAALAVVEADPDVPGIVYRTDAIASDRARVVYEVPDSEGPRIRYAAARIEGGAAPVAADAFLAFLSSRAAADVFERAGFVAIPGGGDSR